MPLVADYQFGEVFWTIVVFFAWFAWIWIAVTCFIDIFRRDDIGGVHKAVWVVFIIVIPFLGVLVYLIAQHDGMRDRQLNQAKQQQQAFDSYVKQTAGGSASEIAKAKELLDAGTISQDEFDSIKAKALG
jgi:Phospholipase_D-nuclease N-terminal/Short C-terminal domain